MERVASLSRNKVFIIADTLVQAKHFAIYANLRKEECEFIPAEDIEHRLAGYHNKTIVLYGPCEKLGRTREGREYIMKVFLPMLKTYREFIVLEIYDTGRAR